MATEEYQIGYEVGYQDGWNEAQKPFVGLTDEDKDFIVKRASVYDWHDYEVIEATEAKLKEKNNG